MKYFDAHTHVQFAAFKDDADEVIKRAEEAGVGMNVVGTQYDTSAAAVALAERYENVWATIGLHPIHTSKSFHDAKELGDGGKEFTSRGETFDISKYLELAQTKRVIAIGECGLDYYRLDEATKKLQIENFVMQIELANRLGKPLMLHIRQAYKDALEVLKAHAKVKGDVHFFAGSWEEAKQFLDLGFTLSFTGVITFTHDYDEVVKNTPLDMILSETDAPYVAPVPYRGKRNEPTYVVEVVKKIAEIKGEEVEKVREQILLNSKRVFELP
ncbi:MAG: TatD family hydrolase [Candidatus Adlerbacteria bacterium]|nr:TatD family hydrolase [Candidatus Adlerbacteria bacterium]